MDDEDEEEEEKEDEVLYRDSKVYQVDQISEDISLFELFSDNPKIDFWTPRSSRVERPLDIMVSSDFQDQFQTTLRDHNIKYRVIIDDVEELVEKERFHQTSTPYLVDGVLNFQKYHRYTDIQEYLKRLAVQYPDLVRLENYGESCEKRELTLLRISSSSDADAKPAIFIDAGIHAREWIAPAFALYLINQLVEKAENRGLLENVDWFVIPLTNPDGYEFSHTENRLWRKTRAKGRKCNGVDANRNFDFNWLGPGSSKDECSPTYAGPRPFSEPESLALAAIIRKYAKYIKIYITVHSAAQALLYPWSYTTELPEDVEELHDLAEKAANAISRINGTEYAVGNSAGMLLMSSGNSRDWAKGVVGIKWTYTLELPGGGQQGFDLPPDDILGVVEEVFEGIKVFHEHVKDNYGS